MTTRKGSWRPRSSASIPAPGTFWSSASASAGLAKHLLRYRIARLTTVEIDAGYDELIQEHLSAADRSALRDPRLRSRVMDGRRFVQLAARGEPAGRERFDLAFIDQPDAWTALLNRYYTREFFPGP